MILLDYSGTAISNLMVSLDHKDPVADLELLRHQILQSIRRCRKKFHQEYGEFIICCDSRKNWRKETFKYYKANRKLGRDESLLDWDQIFGVLGTIKEEIEEFLPYKVIEVDRAEADDVIGTLVHKHGVQMMMGGAEPILILSSDKDFIQLHDYANVKQYNPVMDKWVRHPSPREYLDEHILKGDTGDGVPNIFMDDDFLVMKQKGDRQKPISKKRIKELLDGTLTSPEIVKNIERNTNMIDLSRTPEDIKRSIVDKYDHTTAGDRSKLFNYFMSKRLRTLMESINEF